MGVPQFTYPFTCWKSMGCFQFGAIMNKAAMNAPVKAFV